MNQPGKPARRAKLWLNLALRLAGFAAGLLLPAGTWRWWEAWAVIGLWTAFAVAAVLFLSRHDPALLAERMKASPVQQGQKGWDKVLTLLMLAPGLAILVAHGSLLILGSSFRHWTPSPNTSQSEISHEQSHIQVRLRTQRPRCFATNKYVLREVVVDRCGWTRRQPPHLRHLAELHSGTHAALVRSSAVGLVAERATGDPPGSLHQEGKRPPLE